MDGLAVGHFVGQKIMVEVCFIILGYMGVVLFFIFDEYKWDWQRDMVIFRVLVGSTGRGERWTALVLLFDFD
tara:strand:+ start:16 stop:231 length:216 start_codon:yes stop_codon:yes gene_type:complete